MNWLAIVKLILRIISVILLHQPTEDDRNTVESVQSNGSENPGK